MANRGYTQTKQMTNSRPTALPAAQQTQYIKASCAQSPFLDEAKFYSIYQWIPLAPSSATPRPKPVDLGLRFEPSLDGAATDGDGLPAGSDAVTFALGQIRYSSLTDRDRRQAGAWLAVHMTATKHAWIEEQNGYLIGLLAAVSGTEIDTADRIRVAGMDAVAGLSEEAEERDAYYRAAAFACAERLEAAGVIRCD